MVISDSPNLTFTPIRTAQMYTLNVLIIGSTPKNLNDDNAKGLMPLFDFINI